MVKTALLTEALNQSVNELSEGARWSFVDASARLQELVEKAASAPQAIMRDGKPVALVVGIDEPAQRKTPKESLVDFFMNSPLRGSGIDLERVDIEPRDIDL